MYSLQSHFAAEHLQAEHEKSKVHEAVIGIVTDNKDPSKLGRVKLKVPILSADDTTWWAPIIMLGAGKNRGWFFIPEKGDEVLVMFEHGDLQRPIVIGALWNGKDKASDKNPGGVPRRSIKSRQGSLIVFDDENGKIEISDGAKKGKITFDAAANKIIIEALEGDVCFQAPKGDIQIVAKSMTMEGKSDSVQAVSGQAMKIGTGTKLAVKSSQGTTWSGSMHHKNNGAGDTQAPTSDPQEVADPYGS